MIEIKDYILVQQNSLSEEECKAIIDAGEFLASSNDSRIVDVGSKYSKPGEALARQDKSLYLPHVMQEFWQTINKPVVEAFNQYSEVHQICKNFALESRACKWQKTCVGEAGFSAWHVEQDGILGMSDRFLVWSIYLNDVEDGGETEFLDQRVKLKPVTGTLVMWPAGLTHPHRGNPPYSNDKYIVTGWLNIKPVG